MYIVQCTQCTVCTVQNATVNYTHILNLYTVHCTVCTVYSLQCTLYSVIITYRLYVFNVRHTFYIFILRYAKKENCLIHYRDRFLIDPLFTTITPKQGSAWQVEVLLFYSVYKFSFVYIDMSQDMSWLLSQTFLYLLEIIHCIIYGRLCRFTMITVYSIQCTIYKVHTVHCTLYTVQ